MIKKETDEINNVKLWKSNDEEIINYKIGQKKLFKSIKTLTLKFNSNTFYI